MNSQLIGIPSWHDIPCGSTPVKFNFFFELLTKLLINFQDLYIRISHYRDWIRIVTGV